jgi:hypothetical protein
VATAPPPTPVEAPFEVYAWPRKPNHGGQTVFFYPSNGPPSFSRNLALKYVGRRRAPDPGAGSSLRPMEDQIYYGQDEARWHYLSRESN